MTRRAQKVAAREFWPENSGTTNMPRRRAAEITQRNQTSELGAWRCVGSNSLIVVEDQWCPGGESNPHEEKSPEDFKSSASAIPPPGRPLKWRGSVYGICGSSTTSGTARGKNEKTPRLAPRMCSETRIMLLLKEILPEAGQRNMLLAL